MKKIRLNEKDISKIVKKVMKESESRDTFEFKYEYSRNLMATEREFLNDDDKLQDIIDVYQSHIQQLKSILKNNKDRADRRKESVNEEFELDIPSDFDSKGDERFSIIRIEPTRVDIEVEDLENDEIYNVDVEFGSWSPGMEINDIYPSIDDEEDEDELTHFLERRSDEIFKGS